MTLRFVTQALPGSGWMGSASSRQQRIRLARAVNPTVRHRSRHGGAVATGAVIVLSAIATLIPPKSGADPDPAAPPSDNDLIYAFPEFTPTPSNWKPKFPFPYDQTRDRVTTADITAMGEMCQWFNRQYATLRDQIDRLQFNRINPDGKDFDYGRDNIQQQVDIVTGNIDKSLAFLDPRVHALTVAQNSFGDNYFPIYEGEEFFKLYEQLSNVNTASRPTSRTGSRGRRSRRRSATVATSFAHMCAGRRDDARGCPACLPQMDDLLLVAPLRSRHFSSRRGDAIPGRDDAIAPASGCRFRRYPKGRGRLGALGVLRAAAARPVSRKHRRRRESINRCVARSRRTRRAGGRPPALVEGPRLWR